MRETSNPYFSPSERKRFHLWIFSLTRIVSGSTRILIGCSHGSL